MNIESIRANAKELQTFKWTPLFFWPNFEGMPRLALLPDRLDILQGRSVVDALPTAANPGLTLTFQKG